MTVYIVNGIPVQFVSNSTTDIVYITNGVPFLFEGDGGTPTLLPISLNALYHDISSWGDDI